MDPVGLPIASSIAGAVPAERNAARDAGRADQRPSSRLRRLKDDADLTVTQTETADAVRTAKGNDQEESHEDRQERSPGYDAHGPRGRGDGGAPRIDLKG